MNTLPRNLRVGFIGCGRIAQVHLRYLRQIPGIDVIGFCDRDVDRARQFKGAMQGSRAEAFHDLGDFLSLGPDAVHILTPPDTHAAVAIAALEAGAHVLVEKPMATSTADARRMEEAAQAAGRVLCVDHNRLFDPTVVRAQALLAAGAIGTLVSVEAAQGVNVQEGGQAAAPLTMWMNLAPHPLYLLRAFVGEIQEAQACGGPFGEVRAVLKGTRALGSLIFTPGTAPHLNALTLHGSRGTLLLDLNTMSLVQRRERRLPKMVAKALVNADHAAQLLSGTARTILQVVTRRLGTYPGMGTVIERFYGAIRGEGAAPVTAADGRTVTQLLEQLWAHAQEGKGESGWRRRWSPGWLPGRNGATVLVTGASGFLGRHVVAELHRQGHRVRAMVNAAEVPADWSGVDVVHAALGDNRAVARALSGVSVVVHCAARVARSGTRAEFFRDNVAGTAHLLEAARAAGVERFIYMSSLGIYGRSGKGSVIKENGGYDSRPELRGVYTWSKLEADRLVHEAARSNGLRTIVLRPGILVGPDGPSFMARMALGPIRGRLLVVSRKDSVLPLCHVDDVARAVVAAISAPNASGPYNLVDESFTQADWLRGQGTTSARGKIVFVPPFLATCAAGVLEAVWGLARRGTPSLSRYKVRRATESLHYDTTRARRDLGWRPEVGVRTLLLNGNGTRAVASAPPATAPLAGTGTHGAAHRFSMSSRRE
jgi:predicted dehydrogenase/nucleoside-diphosphate-sugar epimerase